MAVRGVTYRKLKKLIDCWESKPDKAFHECAKQLKELMVVKDYDNTTDTVFKDSPYYPQENFDIAPYDYRKLGISLVAKTIGERAIDKSKLPLENSIVIK